MRGFILRVRPTRRRGFTVVEIVVALSILALGLLLLTQLSVEGVRERARSRTRQEAVELAANILEEARALPWDGLTPEWAAAKELPETLARRLTDGALEVQVEPEAGRPRTRRVTVAITWQDRGGPAQPVQLVGLFSARTAPPAGGKP